MKQMVRSNYFCAFPVSWDCSCLQLSLSSIKGFLVNNRFMTVADMVNWPFSTIRLTSFGSKVWTKGFL